jgi:hypothetical protein
MIAVLNRDITLSPKPFCPALVRGPSAGESTGSTEKPIEPYALKVTVSLEVAGRDVNRKILDVKIASKS